MRWARISCAAAVLIAAWLPGAGISAQEGKALFNGQDLKGWDGDPAFWSVRDGAITGQTTAENRAAQNTFLIWKGGTVKDFELRLKYRIQGNNSGVQYRSKDLSNWVVGGYQADIDAADRFTGIIYEERGRGILATVGQKVSVGEDGKTVVTGSVGDAAEIRRAIKREEWNEYLITARGGHLTHAINGRVTAEAQDQDLRRRALEGILALQLHSGAPMTVQFKEIVLRELNPNPSPAGPEGPAYSCEGP